ncbi:hypothetical protein B0H13DRAFT_2059634, partial [Mycena leptocephala]
MSFKKAKKDVEVELPAEEHEEEREEEQVVVERPKKKRKKEAAGSRRRCSRRMSSRRTRWSRARCGRARSARSRRSGRRRGGQPSRKKVKLELDAAVVSVKKGSKKKKSPRRNARRPSRRSFCPTSTTPPRSPIFGFPPDSNPRFRPRAPLRRLAPPRLPTPPPNVLDEGICEDDEDIYYAKLITHAEKIAYVTQYQARATNVTAVVPVDEPPLQHVESSRSNRANARRRAQGWRRSTRCNAAANELSFKFNQLQTRKKHLRFARSPIHDWGLYAMEKISRGEMVIEYVGEVIRAQVAEKREKAYLFRIDEDLVVDATKKGNLGRLINHSCDPNCTAKIITINGEKKIVIYAKQEIELGDEITYDYHFPFEQDKIPCLCGSAKCRGFLTRTSIIR